MSSRQACRRRVAAPCAAQREKIAGYSGRSARTLYSRSQNSAVYFIASSCLPVGEGCAVYPLHGALGRRPLRSVKWQAWGRSAAGRASRSQCEGRGFDPLRLHQVVFLRSCTCMSHECTKRLNLQDKSDSSTVRSVQASIPRMHPDEAEFRGKGGGTESRCRDTCFTHGKSKQRAAICRTATVWCCASGRTKRPGCCATPAPAAGAASLV